MIDYILQILPGLPVSLGLTCAALLLALLLSILCTAIRTLNTPVLTQLVQGYVVAFTGTPLLIQFFLIYYGPGQFAFIREINWLWSLLSEAWFCALVTLALNSAAYTTNLFWGATKAIPKGQWEACKALGLTRAAQLRLLLPYAIKRALPSYSNEVILVLKGSSLASTITLMDITGYAQQMFGRTYDANVFIAAGIIYLVTNAILFGFMRVIEHRMLRFERV